MTLEEAQAVGKVIELADNNCPICISDQLEALTSSFPEFTWEMRTRALDDPNVPRRHVIVTERPKQ